MSEQPNDIISRESGQVENNWAISPRDFIFRYLKYLPWIVICGVIGFMLAYVKLRYIVPVYRVYSSLLIRSEDNDAMGKDQKFDELFMTQSAVNLSNETAILRSRPVLRRVAGNLGLYTFYYNQGNVRSSFIYPFDRSPFLIQATSIADSSKGFGFLVTVTGNNQFTLNEDKTKYTFGQSFSYQGNQLMLVRNEQVDYNQYSRLKFLAGWQPLDLATESLISSLKVSQANDQATILNLTFDSENTFLGLNVLNSLMAVYDSLIVEDKTRIAIATEHFIDTRLAGMQKDLNGIEGNLKTDMERNQTFDVEDQSKKYVDNIAESEKALVEVSVKLRLASMNRPSRSLQ